MLPKCINIFLFVYIFSYQIMAVVSNNGSALMWFDVDTHSLMQSGICSWSTGTNSASSCKLWMKRIFLLNFSLQERGKQLRPRGLYNTKRLIMIMTPWPLFAELLIIHAHLMNGLMTVITALTYQAGWTTKSPFKSFLNLQMKRKEIKENTFKTPIRKAKENTLC